MESALRKGVASIPGLHVTGAPDARRIRRVLAMRPSGAPPTESLLETLMVQLARRVPNLGDPERQVVVRNEYGDFVARVDLAWREPGVFVELDGEQYHNQPVYDARRQTAVEAATGWLCGRFTWTEVTRLPNTTARRLRSLAEQAWSRALAMSAGNVRPAVR